MTANEIEAGINYAWMNELNWNQTNSALINQFINSATKAALMNFADWLIKPNYVCLISEIL